MQVFEMFRREDKAPLTVFAPDIRHAEKFYAEWVETHKPDWPRVALLVFPYQGRLLECREGLYTASQRGEAGLGVWDRGRGRWAVGRPQSAPEGGLARDTGVNSYYRVSALHGDELMVFAPDLAGAVTVYDEWHRDAWGSKPEGLVIKQKSRWQLVQSLAPLRDEMDEGITGAARWDADEGWRIVEPDDATVLPEHML